MVFVRNNDVIKIWGWDEHWKDSTELSSGFFFVIVKDSSNAFLVELKDLLWEEVFLRIEIGEFKEKSEISENYDWIDERSLDRQLVQLFKMRTLVFQIASHQLIQKIGTVLILNRELKGKSAPDFEFKAPQNSQFFELSESKMNKWFVFRVVRREQWSQNLKKSNISCVFERDCGVSCVEVEHSHDSVWLNCIHCFIV